jgi:anti-sigma-K factor RskA
MSPPVDLGPDDGQDLTAAEYAIGLLDGPERLAAERRLLADRGFAAEVEAWELRFAPLADLAAGEAPPSGVWPAIERRLGQVAEVVELRLRRSVALWRRTAFAAAALAASLAVALAWPSPQPGPIATARLNGPQGGTVFVAMFDPDRREIVLTPATITAAADRSPQLWLLPPGGKPISLGVAAFGQSVRLSPPVKLAGATGGLTLAVSIEPKGGSPTGQPTGPVVATGALQSL